MKRAAVIDDCVTKRKKGDFTETTHVNNTRKLEKLILIMQPVDQIDTTMSTTLDLPVTFNNENIEFNEYEHSYVLHQPQCYTRAKYSVTQFIKIHFHFGGFDAPKIARNMIQKKSYQRNPVYDFVPRDRDDDFNIELVLLSWEMKKQYAREMGTAMHLMIEEYFQTGEFRNNPLLEPERMSFMKFLYDYRNDFKIYGVKMRLFDQDLQLAGSINALFTDQRTGEFILVDWKRCGIKSYVKRTMCDKYGIYYSDPKLKKYIFQLNVYRNIIEVVYKKKIAKMFLYVFDINDTDGYKLLNIERLSFVDAFMYNQRQLTPEESRRGFEYELDDDIIFEQGTILKPN